VRSLLPLAPLPLLLVLAACSGDDGLGEQDRPEVVAFDPPPGAVLPGWLSHVRVRYDQPVHVLNPDAVWVTAEGVPEDEDENVRCRAYPDPSDPNSILVVPTGEDQFYTGLKHRLRVQEGAAANDEEHYSIDEYETTFTVGVLPPQFVTAEDGQVHQILVPTLVNLGSTAPPAGYAARGPLGSGDRVWVWLDPAAPGSSLLGTMQPGDATITVVPLAGEVGTRRGGGLALSTDGRTLYATAEDAGTSRVLVHRVDVPTTAEVGAPLVLSPVLGTSPGTFRPDVDPSRARLLVPVADGLGGGRLAVVSLETFTEVDMVEGPGVDALDLVWGAGGVYVETGRDVAFVLLENLPHTGFVFVEFEDDYEVFIAEEPTFAGTARVGYPTTNERWFLQGLEGYDGLDGLIESRAFDINEGFAEAIRDDVGAGLHGSNHVTAFLRPPVGDFLYLFTNDATKTTLCAYDIDEEDNEQEDLDLVLPGTQGRDFSLAVPSRVTGATVLRGLTP